MQLLVEQTFATIAVILAAMGALALVETLAPLHARGHWGRAHLKPNLALTLITLATNTLLHDAMLAVIRDFERGRLQRTP